MPAPPSLITDANEFMLIKENTLDRIRVVRATALNTDSSRSHLFISMGYTEDDARHPSRFSTTIFADLAGDEDTTLSRDTVTVAELNALDEYQRAAVGGAQIPHAVHLRAFARKVRNNVMINAEGTAITADLTIIKSILRGNIAALNTAPASSVVSLPYYAAVTRQPGVKYHETFARRQLLDKRVEATESDGVLPLVYPIYDQYLDILAANNQRTEMFTPAINPSTDIAKLMNIFRASKTVVLFGMVKLTGVSGAGAGTTLEFVASAAKGKAGPNLAAFDTAIKGFKTIMPLTCDTIASTSPPNIGVVNASIQATAALAVKFKALIADIETLTRDATTLTTTYTFDASKFTAAAAPVPALGSAPAPPAGGVPVAPSTTNVVDAAHITSLEVTLAAATAAYNFATSQPGMFRDNDEIAAALQLLNEAQAALDVAKAGFAAATSLSAGAAPTPIALASTGTPVPLSAPTSGGSAPTLAAAASTATHAGAAATPAQPAAIKPATFLSSPVRAAPPGASSQHVPPAATTGSSTSPVGTVLTSDQVTTMLDFDNTRHSDDDSRNIIRALYNLTFLTNDTNPYKMYKKNVPQNDRTTSQLRDAIVQEAKNGAFVMGANNTVEENNLADRK